jgi:RNA polymerase sigma factor (sigma-70 family)
VNYEQLLLANLDLIDEIVRGLGRRHRLGSDEIDDLRGAIRLKLVDDDYRVLRAFERRCSLRGYLTAVIHRHFLDERNAKWGKWRPSLEARRSGELGVLLERLLTRDGLSFDEAVEVLRTNHGISESSDTIYQLSISFPQRTPRRFVGETPLSSLSSAEGADQEVLRAEQADRASAASAALTAALNRLGAQDRLILKLHFQDSISVARIARLLNLEQKPLYRRIEQMMRVLRNALEEQGISSGDIDGIIGGASEENGSLFGGDVVGNRTSRPSVT